MCFGSDFLSHRYISFLVFSAQWNRRNGGNFWTLSVIPGGRSLQKIKIEEEGEAGLRWLAVFFLSFDILSCTNESGIFFSDGCWKKKS